MLVASELKGELARIHPARSCCRRAELAGLLFAQTRPASAASAAIRTLEHPTARVAVQLASAVGVPAEGPMPSGATAQQIASALHAFQTPPGEIAAIFASLREVGALAAEVVVR